MCTYRDESLCRPIESIENIVVFDLYSVVVFSAGKYSESVYYYLTEDEMILVCFTESFYRRQPEMPSEIMVYRFVTLVGKKHIKGYYQCQQAIYHP